MNALPLPPSYHSVMVSLTIRGAADAITFYEEAFDAKLARKYADPTGTIMHAELIIGDTTVMLSDEFPEWGMVSPATLGGCPFRLRINVPDADAAFAKAIEAGAKEERPPSTEFYGERYAAISDPFGVRWGFATRAEDVSEEEMDRRMAVWLAENQKA